MNVIDKNLVLVSAPIVIKKVKGRLRWFIVKQQDEEGWEIPKVLVRKGESSVRASLRMMGERGAMTIQVLEEAGRAGGVTTVNGRTLPQRHLYYLAILKSASEEPIGFAEHAWLEYAQAVRKLSSKRERTMLKEARKEYKKWKKEQEKLDEEDRVKFK